MHKMLSLFGGNYIELDKAVEESAQNTTTGQF